MNKKQMSEKVRDEKIESHDIITSESKKKIKD